MAGPTIFQGTLNKALVSIAVIDSPEMNVTTGFFGSKLARLTFDGAAADYIGNLAGATPSPRLYQVVTCHFYINKSQSLASIWEQRRLQNAALGDVNVVSDSSALGAYYIANCVLMNIADIDLTGETNDFPITIQGTYQINASLYQ